MIGHIVPIAWVLAFSARLALAESSGMVSYHGVLSDRAGNPIQGPVELTFRIYDSRTGGNLVAGPFGPLSTISVGGGVSVSFGPASDAVFDGGPRWLEVLAGGSGPLRVQMETVYYDGLIDENVGRLTGGRMLLTAAPLRQAAAGPLASVTTILSNGPPSNRVDLVVVGDGYVAADLPTYASQASAGLGLLLAQEPYSTYRNYFNAYRVDVVSNESGVDNDPVQGILRDTALDMGFWCGGIERLLCVDVTKATGFASAAPQVDHILAIANSTKYGGAGYTGSDLATFAGGNSVAAEIAIHEIGHSLGGLADEYDYGDGSYYTGSEPSQPNVSVLTAASMASAGTKWARWLGDPGIGFGGLVNTYEGAYYNPFGIYRPTFDSKMRTLGTPYNLPSVESLIIQIYGIVHPIDDATPPGTLNDSSMVYVNPLDPVDHPLDIQWFLDGNPLTGFQSETLHVRSLGLDPGSYVLSVRVTDNTLLVRDENARQTRMSESRSWNLRIGTPLTRMSFELSPSTLNLRSMGRWETARLEPEPPASPADIDIASIRLNGSVPVDASAPVSIGDVDHDGRPDLTVKFNRVAVELTVTEGDEVPVTVNGRIGNGSFEATDLVQVRGAHVRAPGGGSVPQGGGAAEVAMSEPFVIASPLGVGEPSVTLALQGAVPNPSRGLSVSFTLADAKPAGLVVYDVSGREVSRCEVGSLGAGRHVVTLEAPEKLVPGIYLVHLIQGDRRLVTRAVVVR